jgi:glycosyltransferase involved in cell wall biosynthesis
MSRTIGVILPVRAPAPWLGEALEGVLRQSPAPDQVVVVDDASEPPLALQREHATACLLLRRDRRGGPAAAREDGLAALWTELVALADADDAWEPGKLAAQLEALERFPGAVCFGRAVVVDAGGRPTRERWDELAPGLHSGERMARLLFERNPIPTASVLVRRESLSSAGGFASDLLIASDREAWLRLALAGAEFVCEPLARIRYRRHAGGLTADVARLAEEQLALHERYGEGFDEATRRGVRARDLTALARGRVRQRRFAEARAALGEAALLEPPGPRERALRALLAVPGVRAALGRRDPYR